MPIEKEQIFRFNFLFDRYGEVIDVTHNRLFMEHEDSRVGGLLCWIIVAV
jgi:hypothetical protein